MLYVVRHGETDWNVQHRIQGRQPDIRLNANGRRQARELAGTLKKLPAIDICLCSPLLRAKETAEIIYKGKIIIDKRLAERDFGMLEGKIADEIKTPGAWSVSMPLDVPFETVPSIMARVKSLLDDIKTQYNGKNMLVVTHGGVIRTLRGHLDGVPASGDLYDLPKTKNCEMLCYDLKREGKQ
jgi:probable phosphoglycerate mutase